MPRVPDPNALPDLPEAALDPFDQPTVLPGPPPAPRPARRGAPADDGTKPLRPLRRPPVARLCILHDGLSMGDWVTLRADRVTIGRTEADVLIPHDPGISRCHAELRRVSTRSGYVWHLADLGSRNGTYVRTSRITLRPGLEFLVGRSRYRFEAPGEPTAPAAEARPAATVSPWAADPAAGPPPTLTRIDPDGGEGERVVLARAEYLLGRDAAACAIVPPDDPFVSPVHAALARTADGGWEVRNRRSLNGVWLRATQPVPVAEVCHFLLGEQRFLVRPAG